jgi:hypothetical protein
MADSKTGVSPAKEKDDGSGGGTKPLPPMAEKQRQLLNKRAEHWETLDADRRTIARFDAWTDPRMLKFLKEHKDKMSEGARTLFCDGRPEIDPNVLRCAFELFTHLPLDRARTRADGKDYPVLVRVEGQAKLLLDAVQEQLFTEAEAQAQSAASSAVPNPPVREPLPLLIDKLARYLHSVFNLDPKPDALPTRELDTLFARFASGALRIEDRGPQEWMNAEPDSAYFFALAEFCIQAAELRAYPGRPWWMKLGGLFAALQDVFCARYHRIGGELRFSEYRDLYFNDKRRLSVDVLLKHVDSVRRRCDTPEKLVDQVTENAFWYFLDDVQPLTHVPKVEPPPPPQPPLASSNSSAISSA